MKVSEITNKEIASYLRLEYGDLTPAEISELDTLLGIAKSFIKSYTGLKDIVVTDEHVGIGDGIVETFYLDNVPVEKDSQAIYVDGTEKTKDIDYFFDRYTGKVTFLTSPAVNSIITASYKSLSVDKHEDFVIVAYILCQDMYDNRRLYVDKGNLNKVVDTILGMYSTNLLPTS